MPEKKKYVTLDQLQRFYKRITCTDENVGRTPLITHDGVNYYSSWEWDISSIVSGVTFYDYAAHEIVYIPSSILSNYTGTNPILTRDVVPFDCAFIVEKEETESDAFMYLDTNDGIAITASGVYTIKGINYYIQGDFQSLESGAITVSHVTVYMDALPSQPLQITQAYNGSVHINNDPSLFLQHYGPLNLELVYQVMPDKGSLRLTYMYDGVDIFEASDSLQNGDKVDDATIKTEQVLAQKLLTYYLNYYAPSKIQLTISNNSSFHTELLYINDEWSDISHINEYRLAINKFGSLQTNLVIASEPELLIGASNNSTSFDILSNREYGSTALVFIIGVPHPLLLTEECPVTLESDNATAKLIYTNDGKPHVTLRLTQSSDSEAESRNIAPTVTFHYDGPQFEAGIDGSLPTMLPDTAPANLNAIFSEDGWKLTEYWKGNTGYGITRAEGCCTIQTYYGRFNRVVDIWGPCTIYYDLYDPNVL